MDKEKGNEPGILRKALNYIQGKESVDLTGQAMDAYLRGDFKEGASIGWEANKNAVQHLAESIQGKEATELMNQSMSAYRQGELSKGSSLGWDANMSAARHLLDTTKENFSTAMEAGKKVQSWLTGSPNVAEHSAPPTTPANSRTKSDGRTTP